MLFTATAALSSFIILVLAVAKSDIKHHAAGTKFLKISVVAEQASSLEDDCDVRWTSLCVRPSRRSADQKMARQERSVICSTDSSLD